MKNVNLPKSSPSKDYIFATTDAGELVFKGNFEGYYEDVEDPWDQSATGESADYYRQSRHRVAKHIKQHNASAVLEIGCGLGYACKHFDDYHCAQYTGWDISNVAISKAQKLFPNYAFATHDITLPVSHDNQYDVVILNQLLWYILPDMDCVMENCKKLLCKDGILIVSNAFAREQRFGNEFIDGFSGAFSYFNATNQQVSLIHAEFNDDGYRNLDGLFIMKNNKV